MSFAVTPSIDTGHAGLSRKAQIVAFMHGYSTETTPHQAAKIADYRECVRPGTTVNVTFLPGTRFAETVDTAVRLRAEGFEPAPHLAARAIVDGDEFETGLKRLRDEAGVREVLVIAGGAGQPIGAYHSSMQLLETGLLDRYGIDRIGIAGHPEGTPDIGPDAVAEALAWKNAFAARSDAAFHIVSQFCFDAGPIIAWDKAIRAAGNRLPIHVGIPGPAKLRTLLSFARSCGIGPSMRMLTRRTSRIAKLLTVSAPDRMVTALAAYRAEDPDCGIVKVHVYSLGGLGRTTAWADAVADGAFTMADDGVGFSVDG